MFSVPLTIYVAYYSPYIIKLIFGTGYEGATIPLRIMSLLFLFVGINQILVLQILMPLSKDKDILRNSSIAGVIGIASSLILVSLYGKNGASLELLIGEIVLFIGSYNSIHKYSNLKIPMYSIFKHILALIPIAIVYETLSFHIENYIFELFIAAIITLFYVFFCESYVFKNQIIINLINKKVK